MKSASHWGGKHNVILVRPVTALSPIMGSHNFIPPATPDQSPNVDVRKHKQKEIPNRNSFNPGNPVEQPDSQAQPCRILEPLSWFTHPSSLRLGPGEHLE